MNIKDRWVSLRKAYENGWRDERNKMSDDIKKRVRDIMTGGRTAAPPDDHIEDDE